MAFNPSQSRVQTPGIPTSGQWKAVEHAESHLNLVSRYDDGILALLVNTPGAELPYIDMTPDILHAVRTRIQETGDPSSTTARKAAEQAYELANGYTAAEYQRYLSANGDTTAWYGDPDAVRRDIEQQRKEDLHLVTALPRAPHTEQV